MRAVQLAERAAARRDADTLAAEYAEDIDSILRDVHRLFCKAQREGHLDVRPQPGFCREQRKAAELRWAVDVVSEVLHECFCPDAHARIVAQQEPA
jgi:hypothetical protein